MPAWKKLLRIIAAIAILSVGVGILSLLLTQESAANRDFISYWAAGQQLIHHESPYDGQVIERIETAQGFHLAHPLRMRNAPNSLFLTLPLGFVSSRRGSLLWTIALIGCLMISIRLLRLMNGNPQNDLHFVGYVFAPILVCVAAGQTAMFVLLGLVLFLRWHRTHPALAGVALMLCALKPHLFVPFGLVLLIWAIKRKAFPIAAGFVSALAISLLIAFWFDPHAWSQYAAMMHSENIPDVFVPNLSYFLGLTIHRLWLRFIPVTVGSIWAVYYFFKHDSEWDWNRHGQLLLLISVWVAPYSWFYDESILLPAILGSLYLADRKRITVWPFFSLLGIALLEAFFGVTMTSGLYLWTMPAWIACYLFVANRAKIDNREPDSYASVAVL